MDLFTTIALIILVLLFCYFFLGKVSKRLPENYPPSVGWKVPIIGHMPRLAPSAHLMLLEWKKKFGPIVSLEFGSFPTVAISDYKLIREALADPKLNGRPDLPTFKDRSGGERHGILFGDKDEWTEVRRFTMRHLRDFGFGRKSMESILQDESNHMIHHIGATKGKPIVLRSYLNTAVINSLWTIIASERFEHGDEELAHLLTLLNTSITEDRFVTSISAFVPWMAKYFPSISGYKKLQRHLHLFLEFIRKQLKEHQKTLVEGKPRDLMDVYIEETSKSEDTSSAFYGSVGERVMLTVFLDLFVAGAETTSNTLSFFGMYLAAYPKVQEKLYNEIREVIGHNRVPSLDDKGKMVYMEAVTMETLRFSSLVALGIFHYALADAEVGGYAIPKGTMVITNLYAAHMDKKYWGDPEVFRPERFLSSDQKSIVRNDALIPFSHGKRVCLGENLARNELFIFGCSLIQNFSITFDPDAKPASLKQVTGFVLTPPPHQLIFSPRNN